MDEPANRTRRRPQRTGPPAQQGNAELLRGAADGDSAAWEELVDRFSGLVWSVARGFHLDRAATDDVSQTVWLRLAEHCGRIREPERLAGWLATTTRNEALRVVKGRQRTTLVESFAESAPDHEVPTDERLLDGETLDEVLGAFGRLDPASQQLLRLLCVEPPLDYQTISEITGRPIGSIGPTRGRCLQKLRRFLEEDLGGGPMGATP